MSKAARQRSARDRLAEERARQVQRDKQRRAIGISLAALVILAVVVVLGVYVANKKEQHSKVAHAYTGQLAPVSRQADGSIVMAGAGVTAPTLEIFEDFQCPICKSFEDTSGGTIKKLAAQGKVKVVYRPFKLFNQEPLASNSKRAADAALCAPADKWVSYHDNLYAFQPAEGSTGFSNKDLKLWAQDLGFDDAAFQKCVDDSQKAGQLAAITKYALNDRKVTGTPTVFLNGTSLDLQAQVMNPSALETAILAAGGGTAGSASPSTTPSTTASASPSTAPSASPSATPSK